MNYINSVKVHFINRVILLSQAFLGLILFFFITVNCNLYAQQYNKASISLSIDNDSFFGRDYGYSHGLVIKASSRVDEHIDTYMPVPVQRVASWLLVNSDSQKGWAVSLGQKIWTPKKIYQVEEQQNDRPYAGLLFVKTHLFEYSPVSSNKYSLMLGTVGPKALAEDSQVAVHRVIGSEEPLGWQQQLDNKVVFSVFYERQAMLWRSDFYQQRQYDLAIAAYANLGNFQNEVAIASTLRWGNQLEESFASTSLTAGGFVDESIFATSRQGYFIYLTIEGRYRHDDITVEGTRPSHLYNVNTQHWQSSLASGLVYYRQSWGGSLTFIASTPDYQQDIKSCNTLASFKVFYRI